LAAAQSFSFVNVSAESGLDIPNTTISPGLAVGDFDGDGWEDICVTGAEDARPHFFHNRANWIAMGHQSPLFLDVTDHVFPVGANDGTVAVFADIDDDGDADLVMSRRFESRVTGHPVPTHTGIEFFINVDHSRRFQSLGADPGLGEAMAPHGGLTLNDADGDGDLDVVYAHNSGPAFYLRNGGDLNFTDETATFVPEILSPTRYFSTILCDFNGDRLPEIHAAVDFYRDLHFQNQGGGMFTEVTDQVGANNTGSDMGLTVGDPDMDGDFDIYSTNINVGVFYENDGNGNFTNRATQRGIGTFNNGFSACVGWGTAFADFDNDNDEDLIVIGDITRAKFFENNGNGQFSDASSGCGIQLKGHSLVPFDFDHDGDLDVLIGWGVPGAMPRLYENRTPSLDGRHWLIVDPRGTTSNADGVGCHIEVAVGEVRMHRKILIGTSFKSGLPLYAHFGLGEHAVADEVVVRWPSGTVTTLTDVPGDQRIEVVE